MSDKVSSYKSILKSTSIVGGASFSNIVIGVLRNKVLAVLLGPTGIGLVSLYTSLMTTAASIATSSVGPVGTRQVAEASSKDDAHALKVVRKAMFWGTMFLACASAMAVWSLRSILAVHILGDASRAGIVGWLSIGVGLSVAGASQGALIQGMRRIGDIARLSVLGSIFNTVLGVGLLWWLGKSGLVAYVLIGPAVSFVIGHIYVSRLPKTGEGIVTRQELTREWAMLFKLGLAMVATALVGSLTQLWIRTDVASVLGVQAVGQYQAAWTISMQYVTFVLGAMAADYYPRLTASIRDRTGASRLVNEQTEIAMLLCAPVFIAMMALAPWVIRLLYSSSFIPAIEVLRWQVLGDVLKVAAWPLGYVILAAGDGKALFWCEVSADVVLAGLILGLVPVIGLRVTGSAYLAMYAVYLPLVYWVAHRRLAFRWSRSVILLSVATFALCVGACIVATMIKWGMLLGCAIAISFGVYSLGRITEMGNVGGPAGRFGGMLRRLTGRWKTS